jgi:hypothetical protein
VRDLVLVICFLSGGSVFGSGVIEMRLCARGGAVSSSTSIPKQTK